ncbi:FAD-binding oxidoreductase [Phenylobacterium sp.]|jgi:FAD/FMN-containing dehydrogenase|uniref:FAD-binding oxidoreductase n=1 Tax=Phenylobacterium sp. TaxID=1871053 RepID=UPI002E30687A|nr:FAD-binding oxidoreductase [Phenylobacterium sp.]HEX2561701.1 FAD-binding oxidoreductase [Phenylobacterium sp.]
MDKLLAKLSDSLGPGGLLTGDDAVQAAKSVWTRLGQPIAVARPRSTEEVAAVLRACHAAGVPVTPWGGRTGLVDGAFATGAVALLTDRMNRIEEIDRQGSTMTVQAGCILQTACEAAEAQGLFLPLDLGARGSATIGGVVSTNAGGNRVLRYGMTRDMVLGLEGVLADGTVVSALNPLIKNNTGFDLKQLFIGSEGCLGVVTRAVLRLRPQPTSQDAAFLAVESFENLPKLLRLFERELSGTLSAFEVMWREFYELVTTEPAKGRPVLPHGAPFYVLVETLGADQAGDSERMERALETALEAGLVADAVVAKSKAERDRIWALRDDVAQVARNGPVFTFDVSLKISDMEAYLAELKSALLARWPAASTVVFGHLGDGNLHIIVGVGDRAARRPVEDLVYGHLQKIGGSISAEHGIGLQKRDYLACSRSPEEIALMARLKAMFDPKNILNPGKVLEPAGAPAAVAEPATAETGLLG